MWSSSAQDLLADVDELRGLFHTETTALSGRLRVNMPQAIAPEVLLPALPDFLTSLPGLDIELSPAARRVDLVREGFDCVLRVGQLDESRFVARPLGTYRMVNVASPAYLESMGQPRTLEDLSKHRLVHYAPSLRARPGGFEYQQEPDGAVRSLPMTGTLTVNTTPACEAAALAGLGIIQVPEPGVRSHIETGRLICILPRWSPTADARVSGVGQPPPSAAAGRGFHGLDGYRDGAPAAATQQRANTQEPARSPLTAPMARSTRRWLPRPVWILPRCAHRGAR